MSIGQLDLDNPSRLSPKWLYCGKLRNPPHQITRGSDSQSEVSASFKGRRLFALRGPGRGLLVAVTGFLFWFGFLLLSLLAPGVSGCVGHNGSFPSCLCSCNHRKSVLLQSPFPHVRAPLNIFCNAGVVVMSCFSWCLSWDGLLVLSILRELRWI